MTSREALKQIFMDDDNTNFDKCRMAILQDLDRLEQQLKNANEFIFNAGQQYAKQSLELEKYKKAINIMKNKSISVWDVQSRNYNQYLLMCRNIAKDTIATEEEFNLLKEVTENGQ